MYKRAGKVAIQKSGSEHTALADLAAMVDEDPEPPLPKPLDPKKATPVRSRVGARVKGVGLGLLGERELGVAL